jgi:putative peptidoglycan lipid II flippase
LTTPVPDPGQSEDGGGRGWNGRPQPDSGWFTAPQYDDTGWHLDLSEVSGRDDGPVADASAGPDHAAFAEPGATGDSPFRYATGYGGNGSFPAEPSSGRRAAGQPQPADRPSGRHARHARPDVGRPEPAAYSEPPRYSDPLAYQHPPAYAEPPRYPDPRAYQHPPASSEPPRYSDPLAYQHPPAYAEPPRYSDPRANLAAGPGGWEPPVQPRYQGYPDPLDQPAPPRAVQQPTRVIPTGMPPAGPPEEAVQTGRGPAAVDAPASGGPASIVRSSGVMAVGTLASRLTGFLRTLIQVYALGTLVVANDYNNANTLPNVVYNLALGGILTSVIVPLIVNAGKRDADRGEAYDQRMFTLITAALLGITVVATLAAAPLVDLYKGSISGSELHLMVVFAYFFIPQIFFYGMSSLIGAILNSRGSFAAPMWTPIVNNIVVILVLALYMLVAAPGTGGKYPHLSGGEVLLLGLGTTLGIVAQTAALIPAMRAVGFRWRPRWDFRRAEGVEIGRMGGWMFCYVAATQVAFLVTTNVANDADPKFGYNAYTYGWLLFQLPYAVVGVSVITALLPRMSAHAADGRLTLVRDDFSAGVRLASVIVVPCSLVLAALGPALGLVFLDHGAAATAGGLTRATYTGVVFAVFCLGLLPYMLFQLQLRVFYSLHDSKTPALIGLGTMTLNIAANLIALHALPKAHVVAGLGVGFGLANLLGSVVAWRILSRRLGGLDGWTIGWTLGRMHAAAIPAALLAIFIGEVAGTAALAGAAITIVLGGAGALLLYMLFARALGVTELNSLSRSVMSRFGR